MVQADIVGSLRFSAEIIPVGFPESMQWGVHTGNRDSDVFDALMEPFVTCAEGLSGVLSPSHYVRYTISRWASGPGFAGWHQERSDVVNVSTGTGDLLPHQLSLVVGFVNLTETTVPLGRKRNRTNIGPLNVATMDTSGRSTTTANTTISDLFVNLDAAWSGIDVVPDLFVDLKGICVTSPTEGVIMEANQLRMGRRYDILRSRAEKTPETPVLTTLE